MTERPINILALTLFFGVLYFIASLAIGFFVITYAMGTVWGGHGEDAAKIVEGIVVVLAIIQPPAAFLGWLGTKNSNIPPSQS